MKCGKIVVSPGVAGSEEIQAESITGKGPRDLQSRLKPILIWGIGTCVFLILAFVGIRFLTDKSNSNEPAKVVVEDLSGEWERVEGGERADLSQELWEKKAFTVLQNFLEAESAEERKKYVQGAEMFPAQLASGLGIEKLSLNGFVSQGVHEKDRARGIFGLIYQYPPALRLSKMFFPVPTLEQSISSPAELSLYVRTIANTANFQDKEVMISAYFKDGEDGMKLDWPSFAQSFYGLLDSFVLADQGASQEIFRVAVFPDRVWPHLDPQDTLAVYRISEISQMEESYRVRVFDEQIKQKLEERFSTRELPMETATLLIEKRNGEIVLKEIICWEFQGLGGE